MCTGCSEGCTSCTGPDKCDYCGNVGYYLSNGTCAGTTTNSINGIGDSIQVEDFVLYVSFGRQP